MEAKEYVLRLIDRARRAQQEFEKFNQQQVDRVVKAIGKTVYDNAETLARLAVDETRMGVYEDKVKKNKAKAKAVWYRLKDQKSVGIIKYLDNGIVEIAKPIGVIGAITPVTNPIITPMNKAMIGLKGRNAVVFSPHPRAKGCAKVVVELMRIALKETDAPEDLLLTIDEPTVEISQLVMKLTDACISTGGSAMVKVAYSSGRPAIGVSAGNVQCLVDLDVDINTVVPMVIQGRCYDSGILCTCEQSIICPEEQAEEYITAFQANNCYYVQDDDEIVALRDVTFPGGVINKDVVGVSAGEIAAMANLRCSSNIKMLLVKTKGFGKEEIFSREKMFPILALYKYKTWKEAVEIARANLDVDGKGHSVVIHSNTKANIEFAAENISVSRFIINQIASGGLGGSFQNGLNPTATLGCGSWGNNSISENLWFHHLINICRIAYKIDNAYIPTDEEIWDE